MNEHTLKLSNNMYIPKTAAIFGVNTNLAAVNANIDIYLNCVVALHYITAVSYMMLCFSGDLTV